MPRLFGTSGIRGFIERELTPELATKVAMAFATLLDEGSYVVVACDHRPQSHVIKQAVEAGLRACGVNVIDLGEAPTTAALHIVLEVGASGAVVVTGSHTPPQITGVLLFTGDTYEIGWEDAEAVEKVLFEGSFRRVSWDRVGVLERLDALETYVKRVRSLLKGFNAGGLKLVFDNGNGVASRYMEPALQELGFDVHTIFAEPDPTFPNRPPYPRPELLTHLSLKVLELKADLGLGVDGDGDRALFCDREGVVHWGDSVGAILAMHEVSVSGKKLIVCPVNTSNVVRYVAKLVNAEVVYTRIGPPAMGKALKERGGAFAFEESGKYMWPWNILYGDPVVAAARLVEVTRVRRKDLTELVKELPKLYLIKEGVPCSEEGKVRALEEAKKSVQKFEKLFGKVAGVMTIDGVRIDFEDGSWILLRPSGTEPVFRIFAESPNREKALKLIEYGMSLVKQWCKSCA